MQSNTDARPPRLRSSVGAALVAAAGRAPDRAAVIEASATGTRELTYTQLLDRARSLAGRLAAGGRGQVIAIWAASSLEWLVAEYAVALAGHVLLPLNPASTDAEVSGLLADFGAITVLTGPPHRGRDLHAAAGTFGATVLSLAEVAIDQGDAIPLPEIDPDEPLLLQPTSGTTGRPKGAQLSHDAALESGRYGVLHLEPGDHEVWCSAMPMHHVGGSVCIALGMLAVAGTVVVLTDYSPSVLLRTLASTRATISGAVPTMALDLLALPELASTDLSALRVLQMGGSTVPPALVREVEDRLGVSVCVAYGQSEAPSSTATALDDPPELKARTIGRALPHREVSIRRPDGTIADPGEPGELWQRGPFVMQGYRGDPVATMQTLDADGWLHTGDCCSIDDDGVITIYGRLREVIIRGGENIYPREVEEALLTHPLVALAAVTGVPDDRWGETVHGWIQRAPGAALGPGDLTAHLEALVARAKIPQTWTFVDAFPLTASGKIQKHLLA